MNGQSPGDQKGFLELVVQRSGDLSIFVDGWAILALVVLLTVAVIASAFKWRWPGRKFDISEAEFGVGNQRFVFRPNNMDRQVAYKIWVELSTRKIGLDIDLENDVISEVYDSWYRFFSVTRELVKEVPATRMRDDSTDAIVRLSIEILNKGLRPHLTKWQARFRRWYNQQMNAEKNAEKAPQEIQNEFPEYTEMTRELLEINKSLKAYRERMYQLASS